MQSPSAREPEVSRPAIHDCWNRIGVRGDGSCAELKQCMHCRNCPVYARAAIDLLDTDLPADHLARWTQQIAQPQPLVETDRQSVVVFRISDEWLALPSMLFQEITPRGTVHTVPHRRNGAVLGLTNVRGELLVCVSLCAVLGLHVDMDVQHRSQHAAGARCMVLQRDGDRVVCPVDAVHGIVHFHQRQHMPIPATLAKATATYTLALLPWQQKSVGLLDDQLLFYSINRSLA